MLSGSSVGPSLNYRYLCESGPQRSYTYGLEPLLGAADTIAFSLCCGSRSARIRINFSAGSGSALEIRIRIQKGQHRAQKSRKFNF